MAKQRVRITPYKLRRAYYKPNVSARIVAEQFGCSPTTIRHYLEKYGFRVKRRSEVMRKRKLDIAHRNKVVKTLKQNTSV